MLKISCLGILFLFILLSISFLKKKPKYKYDLDCPECKGWGYVVLGIVNNKNIWKPCSRCKKSEVLHDEKP